MPDNEIPPAEQSAANIIELQHQIAEAHTPHGTSVGKIIAPPPDIKIAWNNTILNKERIIRLNRIVMRLTTITPTQ